MPERAVIAGNHVENMRGGGRVQADGTTVRGNAFVETTGNPVWLQSGRIETEAPRRVTIRNNLFDGANFRAGAGVVVVSPRGVRGAPPGTFHDIEIDDNRFLNIDRPNLLAITLDSCADVFIRNNDFSRVASDVKVWVRRNNDCSTISVDGEPACPDG